MKHPGEERVFGGMAGKRMVAGRNRAPKALPPRAPTGTILPPDLVIPRWVAPLQSPTPFHQAKDSLARIVARGADFLPEPTFKIDKSAYRLGRLKIDKSAYRVGARKKPKSTLDKSEHLV